MVYALFCLGLYVLSFAQARSGIGDGRHHLTGLDNKPDKGNLLAGCTSVNMEKNVPIVSSQSSIKANEKSMIPISSTEFQKQTVDSEKTSGKAISQEANEVWEDHIIIMNDSLFKKGPASEIANKISQDQTTTILEKLFSSVLSKNLTSSSESIEVSPVISHG